MLAADLAIVIFMLLSASRERTNRATLVRLPGTPNSSVCGAETPLLQDGEEAPPRCLSTYRLTVSSGAPPQDTAQ
jgi:hypothetical protein